MSASLLDSLCEKWPRLREFVPPEIIPIAGPWGGRVYGYCTHPAAVDDYWVHSRGGKRFVTGPTAPESFFWLGIQDRGGSEYLFVMWSRGGRRFWFYDQYVVFLAQSLASVERTNGQLQLALERWQSTTGDVVFSGPWGWFDPHASRFENDPVKESFPEEWEQPNAPGVGGLGRTIASFLEGLDGVQREK